MDIPFKSEKETRREKAAEELQQYYADLESFFGQNIFALKPDAQQALFEEKVTADNKPSINILSMRMTLESNIRSLEKKLEKDPDDEVLSNQISEMLKQDMTLDNLSRFTNA